MRIVFAIIIAVLVFGVIRATFLSFNNSESTKSNADSTEESKDLNVKTVLSDAEPLSIDALKAQKLDNSRLEIEENLPDGSTYKRYIASYTSEGFTIYGLLTVPMGQTPESGWPVIIFNHGYIPPGEYKTTERYVAYQDGFARNGYITFKSDYRGHGDSEGDASGVYGSNAYTIDVLNALDAVKKYPGVDSKRIGMWGHSMGGFITLRNMVVRKDIKAGVIWAGVVASYPDLINNWRRMLPTPSVLPSGARRWRQVLVEKYGEPNENSPFWKAVSANSYLVDISGPLQLHSGTNDESVPYQFSEKLDTQLKAVGKTTELYLYDGDDHNISNNFETAMQRSIEFFDRYVKEE